MLYPLSYEGISNVMQAALYTFTTFTTITSVSAIAIALFGSAAALERWLDGPVANRRGHRSSRSLATRALPSSIRTRTRERRDWIDWPR
jgi:hypothetical protein